MHYVYILQSLSDPKRFYTGEASDLKSRFEEHNTGKSIHTNKFKPWRIHSYFAFENSTKAKSFANQSCPGSHCFAKATQCEAQVDLISEQCLAKLAEQWRGISEAWA